MNKGFLFAILLLLTELCSAQHTEASGMKSREDTLTMILTKLRNQNTDAEKDSMNQVLRKYMEQTLRLPEAFDYNFQNLKTIGFVDSPDGQVRIVNWNVELSDQTQRYVCFVMRKDKNNILVNELIEDPTLQQKPEGILDHEHWYGALYYKIIPKEKGSKQSYVLLGWDGNNASSSIKLIDVLYFAGGKPKLGSPVFKINKTTAKRVFFEHSKKVSISLKYEPEHDRIIYDHLSPETPALAGFYSFYVPDLSYDAFYFKGDKWELKEDVIGVNKDDGTVKEVYIKNEKTGKIEKQEIKDKWENPSDTKAPAGGSEHKAVMPGEEDSQEQEKKEELDKKIDKRDKRNPNSLNTTTGSGKSGRKKRN
ncbi:MAG: hypothetical protein RIT43_2525 [Bacteroidota bacterium]|jgi:hypothetical protein